MKPKVLILTSDLSYFLDDNSHGYLDIRYLTQHHDVSVLAPCHDNDSQYSITKLEASLTKAYFWPRPVDGLSLLVTTNYQGELSPFLKHLPKRLKGALLKRLLNIKAQPLEALKQLVTLSNCAPQLLSALSDGQWHAMVLIKFDSDLWLNYLPTSAAKLVCVDLVHQDILNLVKIHKKLLDNTGRFLNNNLRQILANMDEQFFIKTHEMPFE